MNITKTIRDPDVYNQLIYRTVKILDIAYITILFFTFANITGYYLNQLSLYLYGNHHDKKTNFRLYLEILFQVICVGIVAYIIRNIVQLVPSPFDGMYGFEHGRVKELVSGGFIPVFIIMFQYSMQDKLSVIKHRQETKQQQEHEEKTKKIMGIL